jgi:hypothetical protein
MKMKRLFAILDVARAQPSTMRVGRCEHHDGCEAALEAGAILRERAVL